MKDFEKFKIPPKGELFTQTVFDRCASLVNTQIWEGIDKVNYEAWLQNFESDEERYFAACILDSLIYRSKPQTIALMKELFVREIPDLSRKNDIPIANDFNWLDYLTNEPTSGSLDAIIVPVISISDPPTKSGPLMARMLRRGLQIDQDHMYWPWNLKKLVEDYDLKSVIFFDDFLGTGDQFIDFCDEFQLETLFQSTASIYCPLVAHENGLHNVSMAYPDVHLTSVEKLTSEHEFFSDEAVSKRDTVNSPKIVRAFYENIQKRINHHGGRRSVGYGEMGLTYCFEHATPDNSLPLLWENSETWSPLLVP